MQAHAFEHIHDNWLRAKSLIKLALLKYAEKGAWARFIVYRDSQRAAGAPPCRAWVLAYERFRPLVDKALERAKVDLARLQRENEPRREFVVNRAMLRKMKRSAWKDGVAPVDRKRLTGLAPHDATAWQKATAEAQ